MCSKLSELYESGTLKLYRGTVSRTRLEDDLEAPRQRFLDAVRRRPEAAPGRCILRFDEVLERRGHGTVWEEKVPAIRRELKRLARTGKLPVNEQGDLNRQGILKNFGLGHRMSVHIVQKRAPKLKALLDDYDTTQEDPNYTQYKYDSLSDRLKELLAQPGLELTHSRLISLTALARRMRTSVSALQITPKLRQLIEEKQHQIDQQLRRGSSSKSFRAGGIEHINLGATPYSREHRRVFDFSGLIPLYSLEFAEKVGTLFIAAAARKSSAKELYRSIRRFLLWLAKNEPHVSQQLKDGQDVPRAAFERAGLTYQQKLILEAQLQKSTQGTKCDPGFAIIEQLGGLGLFPRVRFPRRQDRHRNRAASASAGLVEAQHKANEEDVVAELALEEAAYRGIEFDSGKDAIAFARTLARERAKRDDLPASLPAAIAVLCEERLAEIRRAASETFEEWREHYLAGRDLIQSAQPSGEEIVEALTRERARGIHRREWKNFVANIFPLSDPKRALANLLAIIDHEFNGICPYGTKSEWGTFWIAAYRKVGGIPRVQEYLFPPRRVTSAVILLYLCESGANAEVAMTLEPSAIRPSRRPRTLSVVGHKARAAGKPIFAELPTKTSVCGTTSAAEAMTFYRDAVEQARTHSPNTPLFVRLHRRQLTRTTEWQLRYDLDLIAQRSRKLAALKISPSMIRPTVLLRTQLRNPTNPEVAQLLAHHASASTTLGYVNGVRPSTSRRGRTSPSGLSASTSSTSWCRHAMRSASSSPENSVRLPPTNLRTSGRGSRMARPSRNCSRT